MKFRLWDELNNEMLYVEDLHWEIDNNMYIRTTQYTDYFAEEDNDITLMESTEIKDIKGKEIFEGDIVEIEKTDKAYVYWDIDRMAWGIHEIGEWYLDSPYLADNLNLSMRIIGNIYEDKEWLDE